jgi:hypothetical protein
MEQYSQFIYVILFGFSCWALGNFVLEFFSFSKKYLFLPFARPVIAFSLGNVIFSYILTALGFCGLYSPIILNGLFFCGIFFFLFQFALSLKRKLVLGASVQIAAQPAATGEKISNHHFSPLLVLTIVIVIFLLPVIMQAVIPPFFRDSLVYHLLVPKLYLKMGQIILVDGNLYSAFPKGHEALMTLLLSVAGDRAAQGFSILQYVASIAGIYTICRFMSGPWAAVLCTLGFATVPPAVYFAGCGYVEPAIIMTFTSGILLLIHLLRDNLLNNENKFTLNVFLLIGLITGWLLSIKYNGLIYLGVICLILLWIYRKASYRHIVICFSAFGLGVLPGFCWMIWNWVSLGNPVYPFAWSLFGGSGWSDDASRAFSMFMDNFGMGREFLDYIFLPSRLAFSGKLDTMYFDGAVGPFLLVFTCFAIMSLFLKLESEIKKTIIRFVMFAAVISASFFIFGTQQARFWLPAQMLICICAAPAMDHCLRYIKDKAVIRNIFIVLMIASLGWNYYYLTKRWGEIGIYKPFLGLESEESFLKRKVPGYPVIDYINANLPDSSRIFCVWTGTYAYYMDRQYYSDTFLEDVKLKHFIAESADGKELSGKLKSAGFTHIFINYNLAEGNMESRQLGIFHNFIKNKARLVFYQGNYCLFSLD